MLITLQNPDILSVNWPDKLSVMLSFVLMKNCVHSPRYFYRNKCELSVVSPSQQVWQLLSGLGISGIQQTHHRHHPRHPGARLPGHTRGHRGGRLLPLMKSLSRLILHLNMSSSSCSLHYETNMFMFSNVILYMYRQTDNKENRQVKSNVNCTEIFSLGFNNANVSLISMFQNGLLLQNWKSKLHWLCILCIYSNKPELFII